MFEQSYVNQVTTEPVKEGDFLYNYEIRSWQLGPRIYQILGASLAANLVMLAVFGQASFLTAKGCDSPLVGRVCQVLDTVYVGALLFGTEREYADVAYDPTRLSPDDEITFVDVSNMDAKLEYPGSFVDFTTNQTVPMFGQTADVLTYDQGFIAPGIPAYSAPSTSDLTNTPQVLPTPNADAIQGTLPSFDNPTTTPGPVNRKRRGGRITSPDNTAVANIDANANTNGNPTLPNANTNTAVQTDEAKADKNGIFINKRPLTDQAKLTLAELQANKVRLDVPFRVVLEGTLGLGKDGKTIVLKNPKQIKDPAIKNDPTVEKLVTDWILRVGDSGWLGYLDKLDQKGKLKTKKIQIAVEQNNMEFVATIRSEMPSENEARTASSGLGLLIGGGILATSGDEQIFLKSATTGVEGTSLVFNFKMPTADVQQIIQRKLADLEKSTTQPNSTATAGSADNTAAK